MLLFSRNRQPGAGLLLAFGASIFAACLLGILSRPENTLAALWPSNALLLGWLLRQRRLAGPLGWGSAALAYLGADLLTGSSLQLTLYMSSANLAGVAAGYLLLRRSRHFNRLLIGPHSILMLLLGCLLAGLVSALLAIPVSSFMLGLPPLQAMAYWFSAELLAYIALLPSILLHSSGQSLRPAGSGWRRWAPLLTLAASAGLGLLIGGAGAATFTLPALLWCALSYSQRLTALCCLLTAIGSLIAMASGLLQADVQEAELEALVSLRISIAMLVLPPLMVAAMGASRRRMLKALHHAAAYDALTGVLSRAGFYERLARLLHARVRSIGTLMIDIDLFKQINERHGHAIGDQVLAEVAQRLRTTLPGDALIGRVGDEEFAVLISPADPAGIRAIAEQLRQRIDEEPFSLLPGLPPLAVSLSIGAAVLGADDERHIDTVLHPADQALLLAKQAGRNQVMLAP